ncbi:MAG: rod shape-determining protein MreC [Thermomicrobiales bacterium]|nr:rod shape-determining protein MreC [Thermomicrobiales bacterium]MEA2529556.1 rod shape-determining protein MreC [Thermomicrobiales bacterium]MEA2582320.1 rod shape-determining protein MreC [Thermomicrobiales bacterium]MEA2596099.1 rod shape-determining protein MreC [Thermomicrobiales bacterium]
MSTLSTRQTIGLVVLFALTSLSFIALDNRSALDPLKTALHDLVVPATDLFNRAGKRSDSDLARELEQVKRERDAALAENVRLKADQKDTEKLQAILDVKQNHGAWTLVTARVLSVDPMNLQKYVVIDKGSLDGIKEGMAVVDPYYFVGLVVGPVEEHSAKVMLAIDGSAVVGAQLLDSGADGIVRGRWQSGGRLEMDYVDRSVEPKKGEIVVTSKSVETRTAGVPGNLIIGRVEDDPERFNQGDSQTINVLPSCDFDNLTLVAVIVNDGESGS